MHRTPAIVTAAIATIALSLSVAPSLAHAAKAKSGPSADILTPEDVAKLQRVGEARISPDGKVVAWVKSVPRPPKAKGDGKPWSELHLVDRNGVDRALIRGKQSLHHIQWTADGKAIAFMARRGKDKKPALWMLPIAGGEAFKALEHEGAVRGYALHPDGKTVVFVGRDKTAKDEKKTKDHGFTQRVVEEQDKPWQVFVHKLKSLSGGDGVANQDADAPKRKKKGAKNERTKPLAFNLPGSASNIAISPNGKLLAVAVAPSPRIDDHYMERRLHIVNLASRKIVGKLKRKGKLGGFWWSPDSKHLAVIGAEDEHDPRAGRLWLVNAKGKLVRDLLPNYNEHVFQAAWRDNGTLVYVGSHKEETELDTVTTAGAKSKLKFSGGIVRTLTISKDGGWIASIIDSPAHPSEVYAIDARTGGAKRLTDCNRWLAKKKLAEQSTVHFKARDGLDIGGVLIKPRGYKPGKKYPLILVVHGGPEAHISNGWLSYYSYPGQVAAARGFAVFHPNYRGSTGRGVKFSKMGQNDYAGGEFNDLVDSAQHFIKTGLADEKRIGITGGSYGGYASAWAATKLSKHFAASVMFVGISDQISKFGTTDIPNEMFLVHSRRWPWKHWDYMRERSPIYHVEKARTPILILHGDSDTRVHPSQSMELFRYLKTIGKVPVRLVLYKGEGHGNRRASSRYDYNLRMLRWFEHYLQGKGGAKPPARLEYGLDKSDKKGGKKKK